MRTTLTLDPDVVKLLEDEMHRGRKPFKQVVNDAIRHGLAARVSSRAPTRYRVRPHETALRPGFDPARFNSLADELEDDAIVTSLGASRTAEPRKK